MAAEVGNRKNAGAKEHSAQVKTVTEHNMKQLNTIQSTPSQNRPNLTTQQSNSLPSTPYIGGRDINGQFRTPSPVNRNTQSTSPRTARSESDTTLRPPGRTTLLAGCKYETGIMNFKRRMPYSLGSDKLESSLTKVKKHLEPSEEKKLSGDMRELYDRLQPTQESEENRIKFVSKLESLLNERWPGNKIQVHVFGSSGNALFTNDSDVDICITTRMEALHRTCLLAKALGEHGMQNIECRPNAKVPIVKMWDPELKLACDMNVNNTAALNNTEMMRTYVKMDPRVRPLAMIIKYWTRRRILNDAALGGTLSSYTWLCMIINFLQCRHPKILPSLQKTPYFTPTPDKPAGFNEAPDLTKDFGKSNRETLGDLLFAFFRRYAHEIDYERYVISVREGGLISKHEKRWHPGQNTRLCVEEPFNVDRNLGNTADDTSFRGVHLELRRAFELISQGKLEECCEQYVFPPQEERALQNQYLFTKPVPQPRPVLTRSQSQTGSNRIPRTTGEQQKKTPSQPGPQTKKTGNSNRRASSAIPPHKMPVYPMPFVDITTSGSQLHETLAHQYQKLQRQEQQLRAKMQHHGTMSNQMFAMFPGGSGYYIDPTANTNGDIHRRHSNASRTPQQVPLQQFTPLTNMPGIASFLPPGFLSNQVTSPQTITTPPSPSFAHAQMGFRGSTRRSATIDASQYAGTRSQSQPPANNSGLIPQNMYMQPETFISAEWQGPMLGHRTLQDIQNDYLSIQQRRYTPEDGAYSVNGGDFQQFDSPIGGSELDSASTQDDIMSQDDSLTDASYSRGSRSATLPHVVSVAYALQNAQNEREAASASTARSSRPRPRASSTIAAHGISFFADEAIDSPEQHEALPVPNPDWQNTRASFSRRIRADTNGTINADASEASEYATPPEHFADLVQPGSAYSSDAVITPNSSGNTPTQEAADFLMLDGNPEKSSAVKPLPVPIQFGQFPARAPFRTGQQPKPDDIRGNIVNHGPGRGLYSHTLSGLGINLSNGITTKDSTSNIGPGQANQSSTVAGLNLASTLKPGSILSPVREVRTPSPTAIRSNGLFLHAQNRHVNSNSKSLVNGAKEINPPPLLPGSTTYARAHSRARSVESVRRQPAKQTTSVSSSIVKTSTPPKSQTPIKSVQSNKNGESSSKISHTQPSTGSTSQNAQQKPVQSVNQTQPQQGGWQQTGTGKKKKNKKAASVGSIALPLEPSERKGG